MSILSSLIGPVTGLLDKFIEDKDAKNAIVGWVCMAGMAGNFIVIPMANFALALSNSDIVIPLVALSEMMPVLMGMLGLGAMRTVEKAKGVQREK